MQLLSALALHEATAQRLYAHRRPGGQNEMDQIHKIHNVLGTPSVPRPSIVLRVEGVWWVIYFLSDPG